MLYTLAHNTYMLNNKSFFMLKMTKTFNFSEGLNELF